MIAGAIVVVGGAAVVAWWLWPDGGTRQDAASTTSTSHIKEVKPAKVPSARQEASVRETKTKTGKRDARGNRVFTYAEREELYAIPEEELSREELLLKRAFQRFEKRKPLFNDPSDQLLAMATAATEQGTALPPMPVGGDRDKAFRQSLLMPIEILDTDSEEVAAVKRRVIAAREEMKALLDGGAKFNDILAEVQKHHAEDMETRNQVHDEMMRILESGDVEGARKYCTMMNLALQQMGIKEVRMPSDVERERIQELREKMKARNMKGVGK